MDSQDTMHLAEVIEENMREENIKELDDNENIIYFFALKSYLTHLTNNSGRLQRIVKVTRMMESLMPEVQSYLVDKMKEG